MKAYDQDLRQKIINAFCNKEGSYLKLAKRFNVSLSFIPKLIGRYLDTGSIEALPHKSNNPAKIKEQYYPILKKLVLENNDATLEELCTKMEQKIKLKVSRSAMSRTLAKLQITRKKTLHATEQDTERVQKLRHEYRELIRTFDRNNLVFIDESGVNIAMTRGYARSQKGERAHGSRPDKRGKNVTIIGAITFGRASLNALRAALSMRTDELFK